MKGLLTVGVRGLSLAALLLPGLALASIGKITVLEGAAKRTSAEQQQALEVGSEIELKDIIEVGAGSYLKLTLNDESVIMLGPDSRLTIDEATFEGQERKGFAATLGLGTIWAKVKKMKNALTGSESKFEVTTERAVAGVRGTIFRVDYLSTAKAMVPTNKQRILVRVVEGRVVVTTMRKVVKNQAPVATPKKGSKGGRQEIAPPQEISKEEWEKKFVELQAQQQVTVGEELGASRPLDPRSMKDAFGRFVDRHQ
ncbi:MAG: FecR domain-containing protein [Myxococcaceae bacterium]|nr:FecR domain-containing protein [Myxococcaceae bacterium]